jgi:hypothetical protein
VINHLRNHPWRQGALAVIVAGLAWLAFGFFGVQTLFVDNEVSEARPSFDATPAVDADATGSTPDLARDPPGSVPPTTVTEYSGSFEPGAHPTSGTAVVLGNGTDQRFLRFEEFATDNGPDLNVYLVNSSTGDTSDFVDLGDLKGNIGEQNYEIPAGIDLGVYDKVVIWCVRFGVGFGDATLDMV